eukprot:CAMPEP_0119132336 /NCGR_PEP_ID=MMETSP1310-20130426/11783_1 /TAXON_ID=464262 /ORGANISM="Genus nov. species nov., Strain RCC2339" /LENGTH=309 /DNA_ID=CAMNT_0007122963 /DNA_START=66 /DNA_END=995 /DNA_ORIENTATION=+
MWVVKSVEVFVVYVIGVVENVLHMLLFALGKRRKLLAGSSTIPDLVVGHRGCRYIKRSAERGGGEIAENTIEAFEFVYQEGGKVIELDTQVCKDGQAVVFHDEEVVMRGGARRHVGDMTLAELQAWGRVEGYDIPTLREVLEFAQKKDLFVLVEGKGSNSHIADLTLEIVHDLDMYDSVMFIAFSYLCVLRMRHLLAQHPGGHFDVCFLFKLRPLCTYRKRLRQSWLTPLVPLAEFFLFYFFWLPFALCLRPDLLGPEQAALAYYPHRIAIVQSLGFNVYTWTVNDAKMGKFFEQNNIPYGTDDLRIMQ